MSAAKIPPEFDPTAETVRAHKVSDVPTKKASRPKKRGWLVFIPADLAKPITREGFSEKAAPYARLRDAVGGLIQPVKLVYEGRARDGYVNEEGMCIGFSYNKRASDMYHAWGKKNGFAVDSLVGDAVLVFWEKIETPATGEK